MNCFTTTITNGQDLELWTKIGIQYEVALNDKYTSIYNYYLPNTLSKNKIKSIFSTIYESNFRNTPDHPLSHFL